MNIKPTNPVIHKFPDRIGNMIPKNELTLFTGLPGTGKSYSLLKFLNLEYVLPILFNLDEDATLQQFGLTGELVGKEELINLINLKYEDLKDEVIVIDTYQRCKELLEIGSEQGQELFTKQLTKLCRESSCTIIIVGHPNDYVGKSSIFKDNPSLVRNSYEHIHLDKTIDGRTKDNTITYTRYIGKGRGIGGSSLEQNWLREIVTNPLTGKDC